MTKYFKMLVNESEPKKNDQGGKYSKTMQN